MSKTYLDMHCENCGAHGHTYGKVTRCPACDSEIKEVSDGQVTFANTGNPVKPEWKEKLGNGENPET